MLTIDHLDMSNRNIISINRNKKVIPIRWERFEVQSTMDLTVLGYTLI